MGSFCWLHLLHVLLSCVTIATALHHARTSSLQPWARTQSQEPGDIDPLYSAVAGLVSSFGYPFQQHFVTTPDGYILRLHRIARGRTAVWKCAEDAGQTICCSGRGNAFGRNHSLWPVDSDKFWAFSWDDMAALDLPATIDYVLAATNTSRLKYVGFSQGTTIALAALSSQPQLAAKVEVAVLLGAVAFVGHMSSSMLRAMCSIQADKLVSELGVREFLPSQPLVAAFEGEMCRVEPPLCLNVLTAMCGYNPDNLDLDRLPTYLKFTPSGTSVQNLEHWLQGIRDRNGRLLKHFDYGTCCRTITGLRRPCNQEVYGSNAPPIYNLSAITTPLAIFTGGQDRLADPLDVQYLLEALPARVILEVRSEPSYEHLDFTWGINAHQRVYPHVLDILKRAPAPAQ